MKFQILLGIALLFFAGVAGAEDLETYSANAMTVPTSGPALSSFVTIKISRWTTDSEQKELANALKTWDSKRLADVMHKQPDTGTLRVAGKAYLLHYAHKIDLGGQKKIIVATDVPIKTKELNWIAATVNYDIAVAVLEFGSDGKGEGILSAATRLSFDESNQTLELQTFAYDPVKLLNVKQSK